MSDFLDMGGYADFIWPAYLIATVILGGILAQTIITMRRRERLADTLRQQRRGGLDEDEACAHKENVARRLHCANDAGYTLLSRG